TPASLPTTYFTANVGRAIVISSTHVQHTCFVLAGYNGQRYRRDCRYGVRHGRVCHGSDEPSTRQTACEGAAPMGHECDRQSSIRQQKTMGIATGHECGQTANLH